MGEERFPPPIFQQEPGVSPYSVEYSGVDRGRCPVCGDPMGDCVGDEHDSPFRMVEFKPPTPPDLMATFTVQTRVYVEERVGSRMARKLLYAVGDRIRPDEARRVGLIP